MPAGCGSVVGGQSSCVCEQSSSGVASACSLVRTGRQCGGRWYAMRMEDARGRGRVCGGGRSLAAVTGGDCCGWWCRWESANGEMKGSCVCLGRWCARSRSKSGPAGWVSRKCGMGVVRSRTHASCVGQNRAIKRLQFSVACGERGRGRAAVRTQTTQHCSCVQEWSRPRRVGGGAGRQGRTGQSREGQAFDFALWPL